MSSKSFYPLYKQGKLDLQCEALLQQIAAGNNPPLSTLTPQQARQDFIPNAWVGKPKKLNKIINRNIPGLGGQIPVRIYIPEGKTPFPLLIFLHGGYFVLGALNEFDSFCTFLAHGASCTVVSVDYRLAPEHKYPAAQEDAWTVMQWITAHAAELQADPQRIAVAGDSAGGNLAANTARLARDHGLPLIFQLLICPALDWSDFETDSFRFFGNGLWASKASMLWARDLYLQNPEQVFDPRVSLLLAKDLNKLPPALIVTAEFDVLRDQAEAYARRLKEAGVPVTCVRYKGMLHDFITVPGLFDQAWKAIDEICSALKKVFEK